MKNDSIDALFKNEQALREAIVKAADNLRNTLKFDVSDLEIELDISLDRVAEEVASGAGTMLSDNFDQETVDNYPAWEFIRLDDRETPRGFKRGRGGVLVPVPGEDWPSRWRAAAQESGDDNAARILQETGRMIALKSSGIWQALGNGAGGYDDALGNPFPPFAVDSGMWTDNTSRKEAVELGLLGKGEKAKPAKISSHEEMAERFAAILRQYLTKKEGERQKRRSDPVSLGTSDDLLELAQEKLDATEKPTPEFVEEIKSLVEKAIERGISEDDVSLADIYDAIGDPEKANKCRHGAASRHAAEILNRGDSYTLIQAAENLLASSKELTPDISKQLLKLVEKAYEHGVGEKYNLRSKAHKILAQVYEQMHDPEKAEGHLQQCLESADGFTLLAEAKGQLAELGKDINLETGARILDMLTKAVQKIPENFQGHHADAYRATAEVLEAIGDFAHAVEYYEFALQKNPQIPVKRRLNALKKTVQVKL